MSSTKPIRFNDILAGREKLEKQIKAGGDIIDAEEVQKQPQQIPVQEQIHRHIIEHAQPQYSEDKILHGRINKVALARYLFPLCAGTFTGGMLYAWGGLVPVIVTVFVFIGIIGAVLSYHD
jgi:VIT1/CCC1 family predicted Fe2+/Mn2+ transporter